MISLGRFASRRWNSAGTAAKASALTKRRKFYKEVGVVEEKTQGVSYKITLDGKVLKTVAGKPLQIESEPLALAVAEEWASQEEFIEMGHMRLTGLSFTAQDNPLATTKESITAKILEYLHGDTVLFFNPDSERLLNAQKECWTPAIRHINKGLGTSFEPTEDMFGNPVSKEDHERVAKWLLSHNHWALHGLQYATETSKSVILPYNVATFNLSAADAITCAMLEQKVQAETWGSVEFAHGVEQEELTARLSAACLFTYFNSHNYTSSTVV